MINVLVFHDRDDCPPHFRDYLNDRGFKAAWYQKPSECMSRVKKGLGKVDAIVLHKDLGQHIPEEWHTGVNADVVASLIHEDGNHVRVIVVSGEYPDGTKHVLNMGVDAYCNAIDVTSEWMLQQLRKGSVSNSEIALRGRKVEMPNNTSHIERW